jgi:hypothetical protein
VRVAHDTLLRDGDVVEIADWSLAFHDAEVPSDPTMAGGDARLRDVTELATRSYVETDQVVRQSRILSVLTRAAAAVSRCPPRSSCSTRCSPRAEAVPANQDRPSSRAIARP